jgi:hypothetical protein
MAGREEFSLFWKRPYRLRPPQLLIQRVTESFPGVNQQQREVLHRPPSNAKVKNEWSYRLLLLPHTPSCLDTERFNVLYTKCVFWGSFRYFLNQGICNFLRSWPKITYFLNRIRQAAGGLVYIGSRGRSKKNSSLLRLTEPLKTLIWLQNLIWLSQIKRHLLPN